MTSPDLEVRTRDARPARSAVIAAFGAVYLIWGSTYLAIRFAIETLPPFLMAGTRFLVAGAILYAWCRLRGSPRPEPAHWKAASISGFFMLLMGVGGVTWAEQIVPSGLAALVVATVPVWLTLMGWAGPGGTRPRLAEGAGIALGLIGVALLVAPGEDLLGAGGVDPVGGAVIVGASVAWAFGSLHSKSSAGPDSHLFGVALLMLAGGGWLVLTALVAGELAELSVPNVSALSVLSLLYLIVFGSIVAFSAYVWLLKVATPAQVGTYAFVNPVVAVYLGWLLADEPVTQRTLLAACVIVVGVALTVWRRSGGRGRVERRRVEAGEAGRRRPAPLADRSFPEGAP